MEKNFGQPMQERDHYPYPDPVVIAKPISWNNHLRSCI